jgi:predicted exporter
MRSFGPAAWGVVLAGALVFTGLRIHQGHVVDTSLLSLLPTAEGDPLLTEANEVLSQRASHLLAFVVGHPDPEKAVEWGHRLNADLLESGFVKNSLTDIAPEQQKAFYELYFPYRYQMLSTRDRQRLQNGNALSSFAGRLTESLYSPASSFFKELIPRDPLLFFPELVRSWMDLAAPGSTAQPGEGIAFVDEGRSYVFSAVELSQDPFNSKNQDLMVSWIADEQKRLTSDDPQVRIHSSGVLPFAVAERQRTEHEMKMVSTGSLIGVLLIAAFIFASARAILLAALPITVGFLMATAATLAVFGHIHVITFAFGSSLIGVAIDYPMLYLAHHRMAGVAWNPRAVLKNMTSGLLLGALTTLLGYAALILAPFPGLRQMALFSSVGLASALLTVLLWLPPLLPQASRLAGEPRLIGWGRMLLRGMRRLWINAPRALRFFGFFILLAMISEGLHRVHFDDDIRRLQKPSAAIAQENAFVQRGMKGLGDSRFILIRGASLEELLERQELLQDRLQALVKEGTLTSVQSLAPFLPSEQRQRADRTLLQRSLAAHPAPLRRALGGLGLPSDITSGLLHDLNQPIVFLSLDEWLKSPASQLLRSLWVNSTRGFASAALVSGPADSVALIGRLKDVPGVRVFDQIHEYTELFHRYRHLSMGLIVAAYGVVWMLMMWRYGLKGGTLVTAPSVGAISFTFALFGWFHVPIHLIHCLSALLVLSMGIDYTIYFAECARAGTPPTPTLLAVTLCAGTTLLSFGLLALCQTPVLAAIGMTVFFGMALAFLFSPFPYLVRKGAG